MTRILDIRITAARDEGFIALEDGEVVAAFESAATAAIWIENRLRLVDGDEARPLRDGPTTVEAFPNVFATTEKRKLGILGRLKNG